MPENFSRIALLAIVICLIDVLESISIAKALAYKNHYELKCAARSAAHAWAWVSRWSERDPPRLPHALSPCAACWAAFVPIAWQCVRAYPGCGALSYLPCATWSDMAQTSSEA
jgi:hypothetical protein